ncbi:MAG: hypothetical protein GTN74_17165 [Proteobacteria bacterium]|nr:hypothetical protein [Pseudomonadota bacterium]NIS72494.1 hypothetical protein [Pseudomonadota bacterium]
MLRPSDLGISRRELMKDRESRWIRVKEGNLQGFINSELEPVVTAHFVEDLERQVVLRKGQVLKDSRVRWVAVLHLEGGGHLYVKKFRIPGQWQKIKYLIRPSRAMREWVISRFLLEQGILTPRPLGVFERRQHGLLEESFLFAEALEEAKNLLEYFKNTQLGEDRIEENNRVLRRLAETVRKVHDLGLFHKDLHGANFLIIDGSSASLYLVDLHHARRQARISSSKRLWNIAQIFNSLGFMLDQEAKRLFLLTYGRGQSPFGGSLESCLTRLDGMVQKMVKRREKSRAKRCLKESTLFTVDRQADLRVFRRREIARDDLVAILRAHRETVRSNREKLLKYSRKTIVSMIDSLPANGRRVCIKEYRYQSILERVKNAFRRPKGKAAWVAGNVLFRRGFCPAKPLAYVERCKLGFPREAFYLTEALPDDLEMDRYLIQRFGERPGTDLRRFLKRFAEWMGTLHQGGIYHRDLKTCNILVSERPDGWGFSLVDLEDVVQGKKIGSKKILRNLIQINCSIPKSFSYGHRTRFLKEYLRVNPIAMEERVLIKRVLDESRRRGIVYVSSQGDVIDKFE